MHQRLSDGLRPDPVRLTAYAGNKLIKNTSLCLDVQSYTNVLVDLKIFRMLDRFHLV